MMQALTDMFGCTRLVIDDVVSQMEKMKVVSTDKEFIEFVCPLSVVQININECSSYTLLFPHVTIL